MSPKRQRTDYDDNCDDDPSSNSDLSTESSTDVTTDAPTYTIADALTEATVDAGIAVSPTEVMKSTKVRKPYIQKAGSTNAAKTLAKARETAGKEGIGLPSEDIDWSATVFRKYQPKKSITTCDRCKVRLTLCNQESNDWLRCTRNGQACTITNTISHTTLIRGADVPQYVAAVDAHLPARLRSAVQERNLLRAEGPRNPSLQGISQPPLKDERLRQEYERLEGSLAAFIPQGGSNRQAAYAAHPPKRAANPRKPANNDNPTAGDAESWPSTYIPAPSEHMGVLDKQSANSPSTQTSINKDNSKPANANGRLSECSTLPLEYLCSTDVQSPQTPSTRMSAQPNNGRSAPATDRSTRSKKVFTQMLVRSSLRDNVQETVRSNSSRQASAQISSRRIAPATNQTTLLGNPYTQAPSPLTYENRGYELYGLATLPEFARPDTMMSPELPKDVARGIPGKSRAREMFPPQWKKYLYRKPDGDNEPNDDANFDKEMWDK
ncbi:hypothetical protein BDW67DRAFT_182168 [Aspergillus spinulosporus]